MAKFLIELNLKSGLTQTIEAENERAAIHRAYMLAREIEEDLGLRGWTEPAPHVEVWKVDGVRYGN